MFCLDLLLQRKERCPASLLTMCQTIEQEANAESLSENAVSVAPILYAHAVSICDQGGFPYSCIRVEVKGQSRRWLTSRTKSDRLVTFLVWNGEAWSATRWLRKVQDSYGIFSQDAKAWLVLDHKPKTLYQAKKVRGKEQYLIQVASWTAALAQEAVSFLDASIGAMAHHWSPNGGINWIPATTGEIVEDPRMLALLNIVPEPEGVSP